MPFSLAFSKIVSFKGKSASLIIQDNENQETKYEIFTQDGYIINNESEIKINLPSFFYEENQGGVKSIFLIDDEYFALISSKETNCLYASLISLKNNKELIKSKCLPDSNNVNFAGLGGAYLIFDDEIILSVGTPEHNSQKIAELAQVQDSIFGKILSIKKNFLLNNKNEKNQYGIFSYGHRNPQGLVFYKNELFSLEHGPQGGDELNKIVQGKNFGWPIVSFGTKYNDGKSYSHEHSKLNLIEPLYFFNPAIAPSSLNKCPKNLIKYYKNNTCLMGLSLKGMSIIIFLLDKENSRVVSVEQILLKKRLRHFGLKKSGELYLDKDNNFFITADKDGLYKVKFDKFR